VELPGDWLDCNELPDTQSAPARKKTRRKSRISDGWSLRRLYPKPPSHARGTVKLGISDGRKVVGIGLLASESDVKAIEMHGENAYPKSRVIRITFFLLSPQER
jgi:hypothetical protein